MSHLPERTEKICLNCNTELQGRYCHHCGQENREPKESLWHLISHFFQDITHFDGKFFGTLRLLVTRPGFLSAEYLRGRRAKYLNPVKMYVFTSALFFLIFFSMYRVGEIDMDKANRQSADSIRNQVDSILKNSNLPVRKDSATINQWYNGNDTIINLSGNEKKRNRFDFNIGDGGYTSKKQYDSTQLALLAPERDGWFKRRMHYRNVELKNKYKDDGGRFISDLANSFLHSFPYLLFVSLPLYALFLKLLYIRRKEFYYTDHSIFLLHLYIFTFIFMLVFIALVKTEEGTGYSWINYLQIPLFIYGIVYTLKAMRNFYRQGWGKTTLKFILLNILAFVSLIALFSIFAILTIFRI